MCQLTGLTSWLSLKNSALVVLRSRSRDRSRRRDSDRF